jgi:GNAT superfamily N-acetyltransferase
MSHIRLRKLEPADRAAVAELICISTNHWYLTHARPPIFATVEAADVFYEVYEQLDPGHGIVAEDDRTGQLTGSCFIHPRPTHVSLGIMNVHPNHYGRGVARSLLNHIVAFAEECDKPLRLVSSAMNLDSFSLYTRAGFVPRRAFQDMLLPVPPEGMRHRMAGGGGIREATADDVPAMVELDMELTGIDRGQDLGFFIRNPGGYWHLSVREGPGGSIDGFMASCGHPGANMIGPGAAHTEEAAEALLLAELDRHRGRTPVFLVPVDCGGLVKAMYAHGARNCEIHFSQVRGRHEPSRGVECPTFMPESS